MGQPVDARQTGDVAAVDGLDQRPLRRSVGDRRAPRPADERGVVVPERSIRCEVQVQPVRGRPVRAALERLGGRERQQRRRLDDLRGGAGEPADAEVGEPRPEGAVAGLDGVQGRAAVALLDEAGRGVVEPGPDEADGARRARIGTAGGRRTGAPDEQAQDEEGERAGHES